MSSITVRNVRDFSIPYPTGAVPVYVGRPSALGNPFTIGRDGSRQIVLHKYRNWLRAIASDCTRTGGDHPGRQLVKIIAGLRDSGIPVVLLCWCAPEDCHADVVREAVEGRWF